MPNQPTPESGGQPLRTQVHSIDQHLSLLPIEVLHYPSDYGAKSQSASYTSKIRRQKTTSIRHHAITD